MTIQVPVWVIVTAVLLGLLFGPVVYTMFREPRSDYDLGIDVALVVAACWSALIMSLVFLGVWWIAR